MDAKVSGSGLFASTGRLLGTALEMAQVRLELLGTEIETEKQRLFDSLLQAIVGLQLLSVGLLLLCGFLILLVSDSYRLAALACMALLLLVAGLLLLQSARQRLRSPKGMFNASATELQRDRDGLRAGTQDDPG
jgi:uncharacterized membrane protein YqjE